MPQTAGVIVYLAQARHSSYGRDSLKLLRGSVLSLVENYLAQHRDDVLFLHYGEVPTAQQEELVGSCGTGVHARFMKLGSNHTTLPPGTPPPSEWMHRRRFSEGYRHMIRLFAVGLWPLVASLGYEFVMRMDEDSFLRSPIRYNIFEHMRSSGIDYAYRLASWEDVPGKGHPEPFHLFVRKYLQLRNVTPTWLLDSCIVPSVANFSITNCGNLYGFYNNFFATRVGFWMQPDVQDWLAHAIATHNIYLRRWNDILWQSAAVQIFMPLARVRMLRDFAYEHATFSRLNRTHWDGTSGVERCVLFGGLALGSRDNQSAARSRLGQMLRMPPCRSRNIGQKSFRPCVVASSVPRALLIGSVSDQEAHCSRAAPRPYHCALGARSRVSGPYSEAVRKDSECLCAPSERTRSSVFALCYCHQKKAVLRAGTGMRETGLCSVRRDRGSHSTEPTLKWRRT